MIPSSGQGSPIKDRRLARGARWFYIVAALTAANCVLDAIQWPVRFVVGLTFTEIFDAVVAAQGGSLTMIGHVFDAATIGMLVVFGYYSGRGRGWLFVVGGLLYLLDTALSFLMYRFFLQLNPYGLFIHVVGLYYLFRGFLACRDARLIDEAEAEAG